MRFRLVPLIVLFVTTSAAAQQIRVFGESGSEAHVTPPNKQSSLNPDNALDIGRHSNSADLTLFADAAADDKRWRVFAKFRLANEWSGDATTTLKVDELGFSYAATPWLDLRIGRRIERWGTGYAWNPTGVVNPPKDPADPGDRRRTRRGVDMVAADILVKGWTVTLLGVPEISWSGKQERRLVSTGWAARAYRIIKGTDVAFSASGGNGLPNSVGLAVARVFGDALELHAEAAYITDHVRYLPNEGALAAVRRPHLELLVGGQYTFKNNIHVIGEFYHAGQGLNRGEWGEFRRFALTAREGAAQGHAAALLLANAQFTPLAMAKNYTFVRVMVPLRLNRLEFETIVISSLRDGSSLVRPGLTWRPHPNWSVYCFQSEFLGGGRTEFGHVQIRRSTDIGIRYHFSIRDRESR